MSASALKTPSPGSVTMFSTSWCGYCNRLKAQMGREGIAFIGGDPSRIQEVRRARGEIAAFVELHVEQGGTLERLGVDIGVVEGIVAVDRWNITVDGVANHGGATPMDQRQDAGLAAARFIDAVHRIVTSVPGRQVATVGQIQAHPGAFNIIPGRVDLSLEMRDLEEDKLERIFERISAETRELSRATGTTFSFDQFYDHEAAPTDERIRAEIAVQAERLGLSAESMPSAAGHDAQSIHRIAPIGMIFIPSVGEYVTPLLVGGSRGSLYGNIIQDFFTKAANWPFGSAMSMAMLVMTLALVAVAVRMVDLRKLIE